MKEFYHVGVQFFGNSSNTYVYRVPNKSKHKVNEGDLVIVPESIMRSHPTVAKVVKVEYAYKEKSNINYKEIVGVSRL